MRRAFGWSIAVLIVLAAVAAGRWQGERAAVPAQVAGVAPAARAAPAVATPMRKTASSALPVELDDLDGTAFVEAMPELERRARSGDAKATRLLMRRLQDCRDWRPGGEESERERIDEEYAHQLEIQKHLHDPKFIIDEAWRDARIRAMVDRRDRCGALSSRDVASRFDWAALALSRHDRESALMLAFGGLFGPSQIERTRYTDALSALASTDLVELERLVEAGDLKAMSALAGVYSHPDFTVFDGSADPAKACALAFALSLTGDAESRWRVDQVLAASASALTPEQIDAARRDGQTLYDRCCAAGKASAAH